MAKIGIIVGSTRQGRVTDKLAHWVSIEAAKLGDVEIVDLRDYPLPIFDEQIPPRYNPDRAEQVSPEIKKWIDKIAEFDGYIIVTAEYNRAMPGVLKNALDSLGNEMLDKPVALVAHGSTGGAQAVASLRISLSGNGAFTIPNALFFTDRVGEAIDEEGVLKAELQDGPFSPLVTLTGNLKSLFWYADALNAAR